MRHLWSWLARLRGPRRLPGPVSPPARFRPAVESLEQRSTPAVVGAGTGLTAQYFGGLTLSKLLLTRTDPVVNLNSAVQPVAAPGVPTTLFSARWTGFVQAQFSETYTFSTTSDDGVRLVVNGQALINDWTDHAPRTDSGSITLAAGQKYAIEVDFYQKLGGFTAQLSWASPSTPRQLVPTSQLYPAGTPPPLAPLSRLSAANVTSAGAARQTFSVTYVDDTAVDLSRLSNGDVRVVGPGGFSQSALLVSVSGGATPQTCTATYQITPPGGAWDAADNGVYTVLLQPNEVRDTGGAYAPPGALGTFAVSIPTAPVGDWFSQNLHDAALVSLVRGLDADKQLSRNDMLAVFRQVSQDGQVTTNELGDLRTLVANAGPLGMPDPVRNLTGKVANGDPANRDYQGQPLGNLTAGATGGVLQKLVNKWFLGLDHPATDPGLTYTAAAGTLFGTGPVLGDVKQGNLNDCYFLAGLGAVVNHDPNLIRSDFIDNGDGTFTVRFLNGTAADYVTVDRMLPATSSGTYKYANFQWLLSNASNKLWVPLLEKAYAQLAESGWSRGPGLGDAYSSMAYGWEGDVIRQVSGQSAAYHLLYGDSGTLSTITTALQVRQIVCLDSNATTQAGIVPSHVYVALGYDAATQTFTCYNPWGFTVPLTWAQVAANFSYWTQSP